MAMYHNLTNTILNQSPLKFQQTPSSPIRYIHSLTYLSATPSNLSISNEPEHDPTHFYSLSPLKIWYRAHVISRHHVTASHVITWPIFASSRDRFSCCDWTSHWLHPWICLKPKPQPSHGGTVLPVRTVRILVFWVVWAVLVERAIERFF